MRARPPDDDGRLRQRSRLAAWCQGVGALLAIATVTCAYVISTRQAVALGLPAVVFIIGGVIASSTANTATAERLGFRTGLHVGKLSRWLRSTSRRSR